jgi:hypothetical protein
VLDLKVLQKMLWKLWTFFNCFSAKNWLTSLSEKQTDNVEQFLCGRELSVMLPARAWKPVTEGEIYIVLGLFMLMGIIQKPTFRSHFTTKRVISTLGWDIITQERLEIICTFFNFADNETVSNFEGPEKFFKMFPVILHLNNKFQNCISQTKTFQLMNHWRFGKAVCHSNSTFLSRHPNLESKHTSCVTPPQGIYGPSLYIQARIQNLTHPWSQLTPVNQKPLSWNW